MADGDACPQAADRAWALRSAPLVCAPNPRLRPRVSKGTAEGRALGLVPSPTSPMAVPRLRIELDRNAVRAQRLKKSVITGARLHEEEAEKGSRRGAWYMLTATYREGSNPSPRHISGLLDCIGSYLRRTYGPRFRSHGERFRYLWVLELTKRLKPHYHVLLWIPRGVWLPKADQQGWWKHGLTKIEKARNAVGYLAKYASKFCAAAAAALPHGFRTHAVGGLNTESRRELRWWKSAVCAREALGVDADIRKVRGGYADKHTGEFWPSPWRVFFEDGRLFIWKEGTL